MSFLVDIEELQNNQAEDKPHSHHQASEWLHDE
jgi:hypothetical protein